MERDTPAPAKAACFPRLHRERGSFRDNPIRRRLEETSAQQLTQATSKLAIADLSVTGKLLRHRTQKRIAVSVMHLCDDIAQRVELLIGSD